MVGKVVVSLVSIMLVVGVVIGVVSVMKNWDDKSKGDNLSTSAKAVASICSSTEHKDACLRSLDSVAKNETATATDFLMAALKATIEEAKKSFKVSESVKVDAAKDSYQHMAVEDCKELLKTAVYDLEVALSMVATSDLQTVDGRVFDLLNWLTAVLSYQASCLDDLKVPEYRNPIENGMLNATQLTGNAIDIVNKLSEIFQAFNVKLDDIKAPTSNARRLLDVENFGHDEGYPSWFPVADRKLMVAHRKGRAKPHAIVAQDGTGQFKTISQAIAAVPKERRGRWIIYVKAGIYKETVLIPNNVVNIFMYGDGATRTIVTGSKNAAAGVPTMDSATFGVSGNGFIVKAMGFHNTAGPKGHQAVAFRSQSDMSAAFNCRFEGYQDTLYYQSNRQFYRNCIISGTVDFIFGRGTAMIQNSDIIMRMPDPNQQNTVTADGNQKPHSIGGLVLQNCRIIPDPALVPNKMKIRSYLGRPWGNYAVTGVIESEISDFIAPEGWMEWSGNNNHEICHIGEYNNRGPGANTDRRVKWKSYHAVTNRNDALRYTGDIFLEGDKPPTKWVLRTRVPVNLGFFY